MTLAHMTPELTVDFIGWFAIAFGCGVAAGRATAVRFRRR